MEMSFNAPSNVVGSVDLGLDNTNFDLSSAELLNSTEQADMNYFSLNYFSDIQDLKVDLFSDNNADYLQNMLLFGASLDDNSNNEDLITTRLQTFLQYDFGSNNDVGYDGTNFFDKKDPSHTVAAKDIIEDLFIESVATQKIVQAMSDDGINLTDDEIKDLYNLTGFGDYKISAEVDGKTVYYAIQPPSAFDSSDLSSLVNGLTVVKFNSSDDVDTYFQDKFHNNLAQLVAELEQENIRVYSDRIRENLSRLMIATGSTRGKRKLYKALDELEASDGTDADIKKFTDALNVFLIKINNSN